MDKIQHKTVPINGLYMHFAELGEGPLVLFLHGFPEFWYAWRHQMVFMAEHGYRVVAPDMRGCGDTTGVPLEDPSKFTVLHVVGDLIALLDVISTKGEERVFVVGHDWGAIIAWHLCLFRSDRVKALVNMSMAHAPRDPEMNLVDKFLRQYGDDHYIYRFQEPGEIEAEFAKIGVKEVVKNVLAYKTSTPMLLPKGKGFGGYSADRPNWLTEEELDYYVAKFEQTGFTGGLNYYRALPLSWELTAPWSEAQVRVPTKFIVGELDLTYHGPEIKEYIHKGGFQKFVPLLQEVVVIEGGAHFINQEKPDEINGHILSFLEQF